MNGSSTWKELRSWLTPVAALGGTVLAVWAYSPSGADPARASFDGAGYPGALLLGLLGGIVTGYVLRTAGDLAFGAGSFEDPDPSL